MDVDGERRKELGEFLRSRRALLRRADLGLPPVGRNRTTGLRREEVSFLSGVSASWYTWLEQGRRINPSRQVLDAVARAMRLPPAEHAYVLSLAGYPPPSPTGRPGATAPPHVQRLLDGLGTSPAFAVTPAWDIVGWNAAYEALYPNVATVAEAERNLLWLVFTDPYVREMLPDWTADSRHFLAEFRAETAPLLGDDALAALLARLLEASPEFRAGWASHDVERFASRARRFHHPLVGELVFEHHRLRPSDRPDLHLVVYTPAPGTGTTARLARLRGRRGTRRAPATA